MEYIKEPLILWYWKSEMFTCNLKPLIIQILYFIYLFRDRVCLMGWALNEIRFWFATSIKFVPKT